MSWRWTMVTRLSLAGVLVFLCALPALAQAPGARGGAQGREGAAPAPQGRGARGAGPAAEGASAAAAKRPGLVPLFDGKTLNNWTVDDPEYSNNFSVRNGLLHVEGVGGWLRSARQYSDYTLRVEFRYLTEDPGGR